MTDNRTTDLLTCPFCGGEAEIHPSNDWDVTFTGSTYFAWCDKCETRGDYYNTEAEAIAAWNTRTHGTLTAELVEKIVDRNCEWYEGGEIDAQAIVDELNAVLGSGNADTDDALALLDEIREAGRISYDDYSQMFDAIAELGSDDEYEAKMDALLCRLTNGKWSKSRAYDLDFMVSCIEEEFEAAELENGTYERIAELEQLIRNMYHEHPIYYFEQWMEDHVIEVER